MSLRGDKYETQEEVQARLEGCIVLYDGEPVYIDRVSNVGEDDKDEVARVFFKSMPHKPGQKSTRKYLSSKKFDLTPFKMGYINSEYGAVFISRSPVRQYRQGLNQNVTTYTEVDGTRSMNFGWTSLITSDDFLNMFRGVYPNMNEARELLKTRKSVALGRTFALSNDEDLGVLYLVKNHFKCGLMLPEDKTFRVSEKFKYLREELEESRIPV